MLQDIFLCRPLHQIDLSTLAHEDLDTVSDQLKKMQEDCIFEFLFKMTLR